MKTNSPKDWPAHVTAIFALNEMIRFLKDICMKQIKDPSNHHLWDPNTGIRGTTESFISCGIITIIQRLKWIRKTDYPIKHIPNMITSLQAVHNKITNVVIDWHYRPLNAPVRQKIKMEFESTIKNLEDRLQVVSKS